MNEEFRRRRIAVFILFFLASSPRWTNAQGVGATYPSFPEGMFQVARVPDRAEGPDASAAQTRYVRLLSQGRGRLEIVHVVDSADGLRPSIEQHAERRMWYVENVEGSGVPTVCVAVSGGDEFECGRLRLNMPNRDLWLYAATDELARPSLMLIRVPVRERR